MKQIVKMSIMGLGLSLGLACAAHDRAWVAEAPAVPLCQDSALTQTEHAILTPERVVDSRPVVEYWGRPRLKQTKGVEMLVVAQEGESEAWVERVVQCDAAARSGTDDRHPLGVEGLNIAVERRGMHFLVRLTADSVTDGREIAARAEHLIQAG